MKLLKETYTAPVNIQIEPAVIPQTTGTNWIPLNNYGMISLYMDGVNKPNQDYAGYFTKDGVDFLFLADGAGGCGGGAKASQYLASFVQQNVSGHRIHEPKFLYELLTAADYSLLDNVPGSQTTAIVIAIKDDFLYVSSVGDSHAWIVDKYSIKSLTEGKSHKAFIGSGKVNPLVSKTYFHDGILILASDGLWKYASSDRIIETLRQSPELLSSALLSDLARMKSGGLQDDISILLYRKSMEK